MGKNSRRNRQERKRLSRENARNSQQGSSSKIPRLRQEQVTSQHDPELLQVPNSERSDRSKSGNTEQVSNPVDLTNDGDFERDLENDLFYEGDVLEQGAVGVSDGDVLDFENDFGDGFSIWWKSQGPGVKTELPVFSGITKKGRNNRNGLKIECPFYVSDNPELVDLLWTMDWAKYHDDGKVFKSGEKVVFEKSMRDYVKMTSVEIRNCRRNTEFQRGVFFWLCEVFVGF